MNSKYKQLFSNTAIFAVSNVLSKLLLSLLLPLYTHILTADEYGTVELITTMSGLAYPVLSLAIQDSVFRFAISKDEEPSRVLKCGSVVLIFGTVQLLFLSILLRWYPAVGNKWYGYFFLISVFTMIRQVMNLYVKAIDRTVAFAIDSILYNGALAVGNIVFLVGFRKGIAGYFLAMIIAAGISILYLASQSNIRSVLNASFDKGLLKKMLLYSSPLILNSISWGLTHVVDKMMLASYLTTAATGIYSAASKVPSLLSVVVGVFTEAWSISMIQDYDSEKDKNFYNSVFRLTHILVIFSALGILLANNNLLRWILGNEFAEATRYTPVLLIGTVFLIYTNYFSSFFSAAKQSKFNMYSSMAGCTFNIVFNVLLIPKIGIMGACIATAGSYVCIAIIRIYFSQKIFPIDLRMKDILLSWGLLLVGSIAAVLDFKAVVFLLVIIVREMVHYRADIEQYARKVVGILKKRRNA